MNDVEREMRGHSEALAHLHGDKIAVILICARNLHGGYSWRAKAKLGIRTLHVTMWFPSADGALRALASA